MSIAAIATSATTTGTGFQTGQRPEAVPTHKALVPVETPRAAPRTIAATAARRITPDAALVAHLWATRENLPQLRARRRAAPGTARAAYEGAAGLKDAPRASHSRVI